MKKLIAPILLVSTLTGCGQQINCNTEEVKQTELQVLDQLDSRDVTTPPTSESAKLQIDSTTQFTNKQTGAVSCNVKFSYINSENGKRELFFRPYVFDLNVADDNEHFTVTIAQ